jgi:predicted DNA-binding transcriptional regulator YafY
MQTDLSDEPKAKFEETKRVARILEIVQLIASKPRSYKRVDLAERFAISERMIQKDLDVIRHALKLPLCHDRQGYYFEYLPHLPTTTYAFSEALALLTAARAAQAIPGITARRCWRCSTGPGSRAARYGSSMSPARAPGK